MRQKLVYKNVIDEDLSLALEEVPEDSHPLLVPTEVWKNTVINFEHLKHGERRPFRRVECYGTVTLYDNRGKVVALGDLRDINEKSAGIEIMAADFKVDEVFYLEFTTFGLFQLTQVKVVLRRLHLNGSKIRIGLEFVDATPAFLDNLDIFLAEKSREMGKFEEFETI